MRSRIDRKSPWRGRALFALFFVLVLLLALGWFGVGPAPEIEIRPAMPAIGASTPFDIALREPRRGLGQINIELLQNDIEDQLIEVELAPRPWWKLWGGRTAEESFHLEIGRDNIPGLKEGEATLRVTASRAPTWLRRHPEPQVTELVLPVRLRPPSLEVLSIANYAEQGGSGLVVYRAGESSVRDGVQAGEYFFPGWPLPGGKGGERFALYGVAYDLEDRAAIDLVAEDDVGNRSRTSFVDGLKLHPLKRDTIHVDDGFLARVVPRILEQTPDLSSSGDLLEDYLLINGDLRQANAERLTELSKKSAPEALWEGTFLQLPGSQVMSTFADRRTYVYAGREVDRQDHLGFDLASVRGAAVPAANGGRVVLAGYFGIYGNTVVVDHGYGLMSLYAHLSRLEVEEGETVERGETVGHTGETGLAGGDHLHFTMLLNGLAVNPVEWWDPLWIEKRITDRLRPEGA